MKGLNVMCEVAPRSKVRNPGERGSDAVLSVEGTNFQATKLLDKLQRRHLPARQTLQGGGGENATTILRRQTLSAFTSVYVKQISSYSANGCETMTTREQSVQSKAT